MRYFVLVLSLMMFSAPVFATDDLFTLVVWYGVKAKSVGLSGITSLGPFASQADCDAAGVALTVGAGDGVRLKHMCIPIVDMRKPSR